MELDHLNLHWRYLETLGKPRLLKLIGQCLALMKQAKDRNDFRHYRQYSRIDRALSRAYIRLTEKEKGLLRDNNLTESVKIPGLNAIVTSTAPYMGNIENDD